MCHVRDLDLSFLLNQASYAFAARLAEALAEANVTVRDYCVLWKAAEAERSQAEIATLAGLDKTTMVVTLDRLEEAGLAERRPSPTDRRARVIVDRVTDETLHTLDRETRDGLVRGLTALAGEGGVLSTPSHVRPQRRKQVRPA